MFKVVIIIPLRNFCSNMAYPKGKLIAIGGNIDKVGSSGSIYNKTTNIHYSEFQILKRILEEIKIENPRLEIISVSSKNPGEIGKKYIRAFGELGCTNVGIMNLASREEAFGEEYNERIRNCGGVLFSGGKQERLSSILAETEILNILRHRYQHEEFVIAGTSAGAMVMSIPMIGHGNSTGAFMKGEVKMNTGFDFIHNVIIDSHFVKRGRFGRLAQAVAYNPTCLGIGLGEDTGVLFVDGEKMEIIGSGLVIIFDGHEIKHNNITDIDNGKPVSIENLIVHILTKGNHFNLSERRFYAELGKSPN